MKRRYVLLAALAAVAVAAVAAYGFLLGPAVAVGQVVRRDVVQTVVASGRVVAPYRVDVASQVVGTVTEVPVAEGQAVKAGQVLVRLESSEAIAGVKQAEVAVAQAQARLRQLRELQLPVADQALRQAEANFENSQVQYDRNKRLYESGFVGKSVLDDAQRSLDVARTQVATARKQVESAQPSGSDSALAVAALDQAKASLLAARAKLEYMTIEAPRDGTLIARDVERGDVAQPGKVLMVLSPAGETQIVLQIDERNLGRLAAGQKALVSADAFAQQRFGAELVYINPGIDAQRGTVEVKLRVPQPPAYLRQDMTVSVDIEVGRSAAALTVPADAVHDAGGAAPWVMRVADSRAERRQVKLGLRGDSVVEVREGLQAGDMVVVGAIPAIRAGQRVRPHSNG
jgi:HlyD family secretion protein